MKAAGPMYRRSTLQARVPSPEKPGVKGAQSCPTVCDPRDYTAHGILQSRVLEPVAFPFSGDLPNPGIELRSPALQADSLPAEPQGKPKNTGVGSLSLLRGSSQPRDRSQVSHIAGGFFTSLAIREALEFYIKCQTLL